MTEATEKPQKERIAKRIARAGLASRREAEAWILAGRVQVNGETLSSPALAVTADDVIFVDGKPLPAAEKPRLWRYHKPSGLVTTAKDPEGRPTVFQRLPGHLPRVVSVGRLDMNSEGLLLLTNDGGLSRMLELPSRGWVRRYRVRVYGSPSAAAFKQLQQGVTVEGVHYGAIEARPEETPEGAPRRANVWLEVGLTEGKNREVRRALEHVGHPVSRLIRTAYGPFQLGRLPQNAVEEVTGKVLKEQLGRAYKELGF